MSKNTTDYALRKASDGKACPYCQVIMTIVKNLPNSTTIDHIIPKAKGGSDKKTNKEVICSRCNGKKGALVREVFIRLQLWRKLPKPVETLLRTQTHAGWTGDLKCLKSMNKVCLAKRL